MKPKAHVIKAHVVSTLTIFTKVSIILLAFALFTSTASAAFSNSATTVYVVSLTQNGPQFGAVDIANGRFTPIGAPAPASLSNLVWWRGELLSLATSDPYAGYLVKINPADGSITPIGPTGLGLNAFDLAKVRGKLYLTDFSNNIYSVDPNTGAATLITATGMPPDPNVPFTTNPDGTFNLCDEGFFGVKGQLYATFDSFNVDPTTIAINENPADATVNPTLYRIDPATGQATLIGPTDLGIDAIVQLNGRVFGFESPVTGFVDGFPVGVNELVELDLTTGKTTFVRMIDAAAGPIFGAVPAMHTF